ncbi:MAG: hypothetical protein COS41_00780 [Elusimicrobia bacterium CG03_land_8_20_14_0_80_50_18]|nr:MAG: hypothetical protein COS41_00780 [Elusimicrobia bacterium CG03_land_8_20_14_0_80_50_18]
MKNKLFLGAFAAMMFLGVPQHSDAAGNAERIIYVPSGECLNYGEYNMSFRVYNYGGMLTRCVFGVLQGLNVGFSWDIANLIGSETIHGRDPALYLKIDIVRKNFRMPAVALGYDAQGYEWDDGEKKYSRDALGAFVSMSKELILPNLYVTAGANFNNKDRRPDTDFVDKLGAFAGFKYSPSRLGLYYEAVNLGQGRDPARMNAGINYEVVDGLQFTLAFENISEAGRIDRHEEQQRTFSILYRGAF